MTPFFITSHVLPKARQRKVWMYIRGNSTDNFYMCIVHHTLQWTFCGGVDIYMSYYYKPHITWIYIAVYIYTLDSNTHHYMFHLPLWIVCVTRGYIYQYIWDTYMHERSTVLCMLYINLACNYV